MPRTHVRDVKERGSAADYSDGGKLKSKLIHKLRPNHGMCNGMSFTRIDLESVK